MFDIGGLELLVVAVLLIVVVGPKELPGMLRVFGRTVAKVRGMAAEFRGQFDEALREAELDEVRKATAEFGKLNPKTAARDAMREAMDPFRQAGEGLKRDLDVGPEMEGPGGDAGVGESEAPAPEHEPKVSVSKTTAAKATAAKTAASKTVTSTAPASTGAATDGPPPVPEPVAAAAEPAGSKP